VDIAAQEQHHLPLLPLALAHEAVGLGEPAGRGHEQGPREVGRGVGQDVRGVRDDDAALGRGRHVHIVVAHRHIADDAQLGAGRQELLIDDLADHADQPLPSLEPGEQLGSGHGPVMGKVVHLGLGAGHVEDLLGEYA
jgi:hypothetical protein